MSSTLRILQLFPTVLLLAGCASSAPQVTDTSATASGIAPAQTSAIKTSSSPVVVTRSTAADMAPASYQSGFMARSDVQSFYRHLVRERNLPENQVAQLLAQAKHQEAAVRLMTPRAPGQPAIIRDWPTYRSRFVEPVRIERGLQFMATHRNALQEAERRYGVPASIIAAIIGVETLYGQHLGNFRVLDTVTTLAFDYPPHPKRDERVDLFRGQLADLIELHIGGKIDANTQLGSFAGAVGIPQFMPTSIKSYAVASEPGRAVNLESNVNDAILSVANFLRLHGWVPGAPVFAPVVLPAKPAGLVAGGLIPTLDWSRLQKAGARLETNATIKGWADLPLGVIDLPTARTGQTEYRVATPNFFALTQYNRSYFYATSVAELAQAISTQR